MHPLLLCLRLSLVHPRCDRIGRGPGYLCKSAPQAEIVAAIRTVARGGAVFSSRSLRAAQRAPRMPSARELEVIRAIALGRSNAEVGTTLGIDERTVESHLRRLFTRYDVASRTELAMLALREGWIRMTES